MNRFSDRVGVTKPPRLAVSEMTSELSVSMWNVLSDAYLPIASSRDGRWRDIMLRVFVFLHWRTDQLGWNAMVELARLAHWWFEEKKEWYETYNVADLLARQLAEEDDGEIFQTLNKVLEYEGSPYRFVGDKLSTITSTEEIRAIEESLGAPDQFAGARTHIATAVDFLGKRPDPDYRNAIKESISAVESTLKILTGSDHADLAEALRDFTSARPIHGALAKGLDSLYGYTSNEHGLRHALLEADAKVGFPEAKFMVVACSGFMNFLIAKSAE
jgi:hypothetical protein